MFKFKANTICFKNGIKVLYVKDLFDQNGNMYDLLYFINILTKKHTILCEYAMFKQAMKKYVKFLILQMQLMYKYQEKNLSCSKKCTKICKFLEELFLIFNSCRYKVSKSIV